LGKEERKILQSFEGALQVLERIIRQEHVGWVGKLRSKSSHGGGGGNPIDRMGKNAIVSGKGGIVNGVQLRRESAKWSQLKGGGGGTQKKKKIKNRIEIKKKKPEQINKKVIAGKLDARRKRKIKRTG